jgi:hypothetical protein
MCNRVTSSGQVLDGPGVLISSSPLKPAVASNGNNLLALFGSAAVIMEASGKLSTIRNPFSIPLDPGTPQGSYFLGYQGNFLQATVLQDLIYLQMCSIKGDVLATYSLEAPNARYSPAMAAKPGQLLVAWQEAEPSGTVAKYQIRQFRDLLHAPEKLPGLTLPATVLAMRFFPTSDGWVVFYTDPVSTENLQLSLSGTNWIPNLWPELPLSTVITSPRLDTFLAASYENDQILTRKVTPQSLSSPDQVLFHSQQKAASVIHTDATYLVYWEDTRQTNDLYGVRFSKDGSRLDDHAFPIALKVLHPSVAAVDGRFFALWFAGSTNLGTTGYPLSYSLRGAFFAERETNVQVTPFQIAEGFSFASVARALVFHDALYVTWAESGRWSLAKVSGQAILRLPFQLTADTFETDGRDLLIISGSSSSAPKVQFASLEPTLKLEPPLPLKVGPFVPYQSRRERLRLLNDVVDL